MNNELVDVENGHMHLLCRSEEVLPERFNDACWILVKKPHVVNSRLTGSSIISCRNLHTDEPAEVNRSDVEKEFDLKIQRRLIPKNPELFTPVLENCVLKENSLRIETETSEGHSTPPVVESMAFEVRLGEDKTLSIWGSPEFPAELARTLLKRFTRWMQADSAANSSSQVQIDSLSLVDLQMYSITYARLKEKFGKKFVEIWPEKTDPKKFVYEDIAIASYLISLWDPEQTGRKVTFVDVGCGNGLLVYILLQEGHKGFGVDVRRRALWNLFTSELGECLLETTVSPETRYEGIEWWIGNHSDELTPWIPFLATMSTSCAKVFLLPCCAYGLYGKFQRETPELSQYQSYLVFLRDDFLPDCGFRVEMDKLRIPSTKRVCFVGRKRRDEVYDSVRERLKSRLEREKGTFVPRPKEITVKNCTQIRKSLTDPLVNRIAEAVLTIGIKDASGYNRGGDLPLGEAVELMKPHELKILKSQCGGLQTLLKNNYHIFKVLQGKIYLRIPERKLEEGEANNIVRRRACWFNAHHPQGCPLDASSCRFQHS